MKKKREFLRQLYNRQVYTVPFLDCFQSSKYLRNCLFIEYIKTEQSPSIFIFQNDFITPNEIKNGVAETNNILPEKTHSNVAADFVPYSSFEKKLTILKQQFYAFIENDDLQEKYYAHDIKKTPILRVLKAIASDFKNLKQKSRSDKEYNTREFSESIIQKIIHDLEGLGIPLLTKEVLSQFKNNAANEYLDLFLNDDSDHKAKYGITIEQAKNKYLELKRFADNYTNNYLKELALKEQEIFTQINPIGTLNNKEINKNLNQLNSISDKLDYLDKVKINYYDKFESIKNTLSPYNSIFWQTNHRTFHEHVFEDHKFITPLCIPKKIHDLHFKNGLNNPEFTYWFLKYNSIQAFYLHINGKEFKNKVNSDLKTTFIEAELKQLNDFETKAKNLLLNKELDIYKPHLNNYKYSREVVLLRVLEGNYYKQNTLYAISNFGSEVQAYYKYKLLKPYLVSAQNEFPLKINTLFQFIEYLHSNIDNFNQSNDLITDLEQLNKKRSKLNRESNYKDKLQFDIIQAELDSKFKILQDNTANLIKTKAKELKVCDFSKEPNYIWYGIEAQIQQLKQNFSNEDLPKIFKHKSLYLQYRSKTHKTFLSLQLFFDELDEIAKSLFDYFKETQKNEFEAFEAKSIKVNSIEEGIELLKVGQTSFTLPYNNIFNPSRRKQQEQTLLTEQNNNQKPESIDWLEIFSQIDVEKDINRQVHKTTTYEQKKGYFSKASFTLTLQYLHSFKKETDFLAPQRKLDYINTLDIAPPKIGSSENSTFNQTVFEAQRNYHEFIIVYKAELTNIKAEQSHKTIQKPSNNTNALQVLKSIWLAESKITVEDFLSKGIEKGIWSKQYKIMVKKGSVYSTGKTLLGSLSIALKGFAISEQTDYKVIGIAFCEAFNESIKETTGNPYKAFSSGNQKAINELKKAYNIK